MTKSTIILNLGDAGTGPSHSFTKSSNDRRANAREKLAAEKKLGRRAKTLTKPELAKLKLVSGTPVIGIDAIEAYTDFLAGDLDTPAVRGLQKEVSNAKKIVIVAHGGPVDTDTVVYKRADGTTMPITANQLAGFVSALIIKQKQDYFVALFCCYAARVPDAEIQQTGLDEGQLASTLAYKFFKALQPAVKSLTVTARTGAVSVSRYIIGAQTQRDDVAHNDAEFARFVGSDAYQNAKSLYAECFGTIDFPRKEEPFPPVDKAGELRMITANSGSATAPPKFLSQREWDAAVGYAKLKSEAQRWPRDPTTIPKYGKIIYHYDDGTLTILNRYSDHDGDKGQVQSKRRNKSYDGVILYRGAML